MASEYFEEEENRDNLLKQVILDVEPKEYVDRRKRDKLFRLRSLFEDVKQRTKAKMMEILGSDWLYLALLGLLMGIFSFSIDICIELLRHCHLWLFYACAQVLDNLAPFLQYFVWVGYTLLLILSSAAICHWIAPQAVGSGIPQMKTILRGVVLKEYLTFRTLVAKFTGLILALGSGLPMGKEGPFVHIASILATLLSRLVVSFKGIYENESRSSEMLAAACAVGVAGTYGAPVGGVLFSIEVTSVFFPLRNYWRGFFSTVCSAVIFRLLTVWFKQEDTVVAFSRTEFPSEYPFDPKELFVFAAIGILCGFGGALFIVFHTKYVHFVGENKYVQAIIKKNHFIYPTFATLIIASLRCPLGYGRLFAGGLTPRETLDELFCNFSWNEPVANSTVHTALIHHWSSDSASIFLILTLYTVNMFWMTAVAITLPVPSGVFIPVFVTGAAFGRLIGETMALIFPNGVRYDAITHIVPGAYAIVGASAFAGSVTHAISTSVIVFEITGQILYILPVILAVLLANAICSRFTPSIYDSIIKVKRLPYLPGIPPTASKVHHIYVEDIMQRDVKYISLKSTYKELKDLLEDMPRLKAFPIVDRPSSLIILGSIPRTQLEGLMESQIGHKVRQTEARRRHWMRKPGFVKPDVSMLEYSDNARKSSLRKFRSQDDLDISTKPVPPIMTRQRYLSGPEIETLRCNMINNNITQIQTKKRFFTNVGNKVQNWSKKIKRSLQLPSNLHDHHLRRLADWLKLIPAIDHYDRDNSTVVALYFNLQELSDVDLSDGEKAEWETTRLNQHLNFDLLSIDPAPFQLVERTSLYKVHALFSLLGLNRAYVTCLGRLVGVVALRELRLALENAQISPGTKNQTRKMSAISVEEKILLGTSLGFSLRPSFSIPTKLHSLDGRALTDRPLRSSVARSSSGFDLSTYHDDGVSFEEHANFDDDDDDHVTKTLRKLSARNSKIEKTDVPT